MGLRKRGIVPEGSGLDGKGKILKNTTQTENEKTGCSMESSG